MSNYTYSEIFSSIEGEALHAGKPTIYSRFANCNFECRGFNNPEMIDTTTVQGIGFDPRDYKTLQEIPLITKGCDSIYSWDPKFAHMWTKCDEHEHANALLDLLPNRSFIRPSGLRTMWSITGGEPTLLWKTLPTLINTPELEECNHILIETNCSVPFKQSFLDGIQKWLEKDDTRVWTWSNSPKLRASGEPWDKAIRPEIAMLQASLVEKFPNRVEQYFKFVCDDNDADFEEVAKAMKAYHDAGISPNTPVYIMPVACQEENQQAIAQKVAERCMQLGYIYCHRVHLSTFGNTIGT